MSQQRHRARRRPVLAALLAASLVPVGCGTILPVGCGGGAAGATPACTYPPTPAPGAISEDEAIAAALRLVPASGGLPVVVWAAVTDDPFAAPAGGDRPLVWEVRLEGFLDADPCPSGFLDRVPAPSDQACLDSESGIVVVLDQYTGVLLGWTH